jgi:hypothetical protein
MGSGAKQELSYFSDRCEMNTKLAGLQNLRDAGPFAEVRMDGDWE